MRMPQTQSNSWKVRQSKNSSPSLFWSTDIFLLENSSSLRQSRSLVSKKAKARLVLEKDQKLIKNKTANRMNAILRKKNKEAAKETKISTNSPAVISQMSFDAGDIIKKPRITEKSGIKAETEGVYTFEVTEKANKKNIAKAVKMLYKVDAVKVNITKLPAKNIVMRGKRGRISGVKKAVVFLKKGDKIEFI